ncbi:hypothetical protein MGN70_012783 [Eutypa lata]|nr:hypothetical protein MGN70_012783 [Eutypa lata]
MEREIVTHYRDVEENGKESTSPPPISLATPVPHPPTKGENETDTENRDDSLAGAGNDTSEMPIIEVMPRTTNDNRETPAIDGIGNLDSKQGAEGASEEYSGLSVQKEVSESEIPSDR